MRCASVKSEVLTVPVPKQVLAAVDRAANSELDQPQRVCAASGDEGLLGIQGLRAGRVHDEAAMA